MDIGTALSVGGSLLGAFGGGKKKEATTQSGYVTLPTDQKDFASGEVWDAIKKYFGTGYQGLPKRRINAEDTDPIFGSKARMDLQQYYDQMPKNPTQAQPVADQSAGLAGVGRMLAQQMAGQGGMYSTKATQPWQDFITKATNEDYATLGKSGGNAIQGSGIYGGTLIDSKTGQPVEGLAQLLAKYR